MPAKGLVKLLEGAAPIIRNKGGVSPAHYVPPPSHMRGQIQLLERDLSGGEPSKVMRKHGFKPYRKGSYSDVYRHPETGLIVKLYQDRGYRHFLDDTWNYKSDNFPRYYGRVDRADGSDSAVFMEDLVPQSGDNLLRPWDPPDLVRAQKYLDSRLDHHSRAIRPDVHDGNIMQRQDGTLVIIDPWMDEFSKIRK